LRRAVNHARREGGDDEPETLTEGKPVIAEEKITSKSGEKCGLAEEKYAIEGALLFGLHPENAETAVINLTITESTAVVWQSGGQAGERQVTSFHGREQKKDSS
jgi:hypothetical protein